MKKICRVVAIIFTILYIFEAFSEGNSVQAASKYLTRNDNLWVWNNEPMGKDTIKIDNMIYYTLDDYFYSYNIDSKERNKIVKIKGDADYLYYSNCKFYVLTTVGNKLKKNKYGTEIKKYDVYRIDIENRKSEKFLDDITRFVGYSDGKYWFEKNGKLMSITGIHKKAKKYFNANGSVLCNKSIYFYSQKKVKKTKKNISGIKNIYHKFNISTGKSSKISEKKYFKFKGVMTEIYYPEKGVNNGGTSSIIKNLAGDWSYYEDMFFNDKGPRIVQTFKKGQTKKTDLYTGPKNKTSMAACLLKDYIVVRISSKKSSELILIDYKGNYVGSLGKEKYTFNF